MTILYGFWLSLVEHFGRAGAAMVKIYGGIIAALLVAILLASVRAWRQRRREAKEWAQWRRRRRLEAIAASQEGRHVA